MSRAFAAAAVAAACAGAAAPARACDASARGRPVRAGTGPGHPPLVVGDSTLIYAAPILGRLGLRADAHGCRQFVDGVGLLARAAARHRLGTAAVLALGANGVVSRREIARARAVLGPERVLGLVTPPNLPASARAMRAAAAAHPDAVLLLDWAAFSARSPGWFGGDRLHPTPAGARTMARFIRRGLRPFLRRPALPSDVGAAGVLACGRLRTHGRARRVYVVRGAKQMGCAGARRLSRSPRLAPPPGWRWADLRRTRGAAGWREAWVRGDEEVVVATTTLG